MLSKFIGNLSKFINSCNPLTTAVLIREFLVFTFNCVLKAFRLSWFLFHPCLWPFVVVVDHDELIKAS